MKTRLFAVTLLTIALVCGVIACNAYADWGKSDKGGDKCDVTMKAKMILMNKDELGLSDKQVKQIKDIKIQSKKDQIQKQAEIDLTAVDLKAKMWDDAMDTAGINKLIDKKYDLKKEKAKANVQAIADLKNVLTQEQKDKLKTLKKACKMKKGMRK